MAHQYVYSLGNSSRMIRFGADRSFAAGHNVIPSSTHPLVMEAHQKPKGCENCNEYVLIAAAVFVLWLAMR